MATIVTRGDRYGHPPIVAILKPRGSTDRLPPVLGRPKADVVGVGLGDLEVFAKRLANHGRGRLVIVLGALGQCLAQLGL
jgi:hypothetical protein